MPKYLDNIDLSQNQLLNASLQTLSSAPGSPVVGQIYLDTTLGTFGAYTASGWVYVGEANYLPITGGTLTGSLVVDDNLTVDGTVTVGGQELGSAAFAATSAFDAAGDAASALTAAEAYANANMVNVAGDSMTGPLVISAGQAAGGVVSVTNTHSAPTAASLQVFTKASGDQAIGVQVTGAADPTFYIDSSGLLHWGTGAATPDTVLQRNSSNSLQTASLLCIVAKSTGLILAVNNTTSSPTAPSTSLTAAAAADNTFGIEVSGDADYRFTIDSNGKHQWGSGAGAADTNLYRTAANSLKTDYSLTVSESLYVAASALTVTTNGAALDYGLSGGGAFKITNTSTPTAPTTQLVAAAAADNTFGIEVSGDADFRFTVDSNGKHLWGSGSAAGDTDLYRSAAGVLTTDETFNAVTAVQVNGTSLLALQATTGTAGYTLHNATPNILTWTVPNDGQLHRIVVMVNADITSAETGGAVGLNGLISPNGASHSLVLLAGGAGVGLEQVCSSFFVEAGSTVTLAQTSALSVGVGILWAEIWAS